MATKTMDSINRKQSQSTHDTVSLLPKSNSSNLDKAKTRWVTVEPIIVFIFMGAGVLATIRLQYLQQRIAKDVYNYTFVANSNTSCGNTNNHENNIVRAIQQRTADLSLELSICKHLPLIFSVIPLGKLSDIIGRKVSMLLPLAGLMVETLLHIVVIKFHLSYTLLYISDALLGISGGTSLIFSISLAYIADVTDKTQRAFHIAVMEVCVISSIGVSQLIVGFLIEAGGFNAPFYYILCSQILALLYIITPGVLHESNQYSSSGGTFLSKMSSLFHGIADLYTNNEDSRRWRLFLLNVIFFLISLSKWYSTVLALYVIGLPFCWSSVIVGIFMAYSYTIYGIAGIVGSRMLNKYLPDIWIKYISIMGIIADTTIIGLAKSTPIMFLGCLQIIPFATVKAMLSKWVSSNEQGVAFAVFAMVDSLASSLGPILYKKLYSKTVVAGKPGVPFFTAAGVSALAVLFTIILHRLFLLTPKDKSAIKQQGNTTPSV